MQIPVIGRVQRMALIDDEDASAVEQHRWRLMRTKEGKEYALCKVSGIGTVYMHRLLTQAPRGLEVDHINGNGLDNRRANLRLATRQENCRNKPGKLATRSGYKGVAFDRRRIKRPWSASIYVNRRRITLGTFASAEEAARAYDVAAQELFGEFAYLNFTSRHEA